MLPKGRRLPGGAGYHHVKAPRQENSAKEAEAVEGRKVRDASCKAAVAREPVENE